MDLAGGVLRLTGHVRSRYVHGVDWRPVYAGVAAADDTASNAAVYDHSVGLETYDETLQYTYTHT